MSARAGHKLKLSSTVKSLSLVSISGVSKKVELTDGGVCGKAGQQVPVSEVMPWTRIDEVLVGGGDS